MNGSVLVVGGGVAGMTAAHELAERDFSVTVLEHRTIPGGKARSLPVPSSGTHERRDLPAEHGFRFFPGFYRHVPDTMQRIPFGDGKQSVFENLRAATDAEIAQATGLDPMRMPTHFPGSTADMREIAATVFRPTWGLTGEDLDHFTGRLLTLLASCEERRFAQWEHQSWWDFAGAAQRSSSYQRFLADGLTRTLVAAQAKEMSARTGGYILLQLLFDIAVPGREADRVLNGPTNDVWIDPWLDHLKTLGVDYRTDVMVTRLVCTDDRITGVEVTSGGATQTLSADYYVVAVPVEHMVLLASPELKALEPRLDNLTKLVTRWMNGILFYLREDVPVVHGHVIYIDSPWSLTSVSQRQFWEGFDFGAIGDGSVGGILSVDISDWNTPGMLFKKPAMQCSQAEIHDEVWAQLKEHLNRPGDTVLEDANVVRWFLDEDVHCPEVQGSYDLRTDINLEPLLVNTIGSWEDRPDATTAVANLFLAGDYVRTHTDLATMEGANESARRAVNGILSAAGVHERPCAVWPLHEPAIFAPARRIDQWRFHHGLEVRLPDHALARMGVRN